MVVHERERKPGIDAGARAERALAAFAQAGPALAASSTLRAAAASAVEAVALATGAEVVVARLLEGTGAHAVACSVWARSRPLAAELDGSRYPAAELPSGEVDRLAAAPEAIRRVATRAGATALLIVPLPGAQVSGSVELLRAGLPFDDTDRLVARLAATQIRLALRAFAQNGTEGWDDAAALAFAGDALAAGTDEDFGAGMQIARLSATAAGAAGALLWGVEEGGGPVLLAASGSESSRQAAAAAARALRELEPVTLEPIAGGIVSATILLGRPPLGVLQLLFEQARAPGQGDLARLGFFGVRAAQALRAGGRVRALELELEQTRALLTVVSGAYAELSLAHTLQTAVDRIAELLASDRLAIYLREGGRLAAAAGRGLAGPHVRAAERLLDLLLGPLRARGVLVVDDAGADPRLEAVAGAFAEAGIEAVVAVPLVVKEDVIGLLAVYPPPGRTLSAGESDLLGALGAQLAVAVQNAQLHEQAKRLGSELETALGSERQAARRLRALYEISRSFAQSLSLDATLEAVVRTVVEVLDVDAAVIRMPDERRERLVPLAMHVSDAKLVDPVRTILFRSWPFGVAPIQRQFRQRKSFTLDRQAVEALGTQSLLEPFLEKGWTGAVVPIATPAEVLASLAFFSLRPGRSVTSEAIETALAIAGQAALAIDNARLYQQQKDFADTMQQSLLPRSLPLLDQLELGAAYQSSGRAEVGGDVYDFLVLEDGRLAVVLGDVTGHGIDAAADMAMAKFVFRSLAREHPEPGDFLSYANDVVVGEIAPGKFITMAYVVVDGTLGRVACAGAGHPPPRLLAAGGAVGSLEVSGLALGIDPGQRYAEVVVELAPADSLVLYTDGVIEARRRGELYGVERLDALLGKRRSLGPRELAQAVLADCRFFAGGELGDDAAVVVIRRSG